MTRADDWLPTICEISMLLPNEIVAPYLAMPPANIDGAAKALKIEVRRATLAMDDALNIELRDGHWHVFLNRKLDSLHRRFAVAHVVSHYLLHRDLIEPLMEGYRIHRECHRYRSRLPETIERQASRFAVSLLISRREAQAMPRQADDEQMAQALVDRFEIPPAIARLCVQDYGLSAVGRSEGGRAPQPAEIAR